MSLCIVYRLATITITIISYNIANFYYIIILMFWCLMSYLVHPTSKLSARWAGPFRIAKISSAKLVDRPTSSTCRFIDEALYCRSWCWRAGSVCSWYREQVDAILDHRRTSRKLVYLKFQVQWSDGDVTWELENGWGNLPPWRILYTVCARSLRCGPWTQRKYRKFALLCFYVMMSTLTQFCEWTKYLVTYKF